MKELVIIVGENLLKEFYPRTNEFTSRVIAFPENYEHPKKQAEMIERICIEFNENNDSLYVLTNSPYIVDHLSSLMRAYKLGDDTIAEEFLLKNSNAFVDPENVVVSLFDKGNYKNLLNKDDCIINWETFSTVSEDLMQIWDKVIEREEINTHN